MTGSRLRQGDLPTAASTGGREPVQYLKRRGGLAPRAVSKTACAGIDTQTPCLTDCSQEWPSPAVRCSMPCIEMEAQIIAAVGRAYPGYTGAALIEIGETLRGASVWLLIGDWLLDDANVLIDIRDDGPAWNGVRGYWPRRRIAKPPPLRQMLTPKVAGPALRVTLGELLRARRS